MLTEIKLILGVSMQVVMDTEVQAVIEFMQRNIPTARLVSAAAGIHAIAPLLWGQYEPEDVRPLTLRAGGLHTPTSASGSIPEIACAGDGSAGGACALR